jgi:chemosensory pili system protein ChpA (sensor histidine kinase/response regulator)
MSKDKELEIQLQFLDEAQEYLNTLESALLGLADSRSIDIQKINAALRAAHSIKGGAGMMGFQTLSELAHRLEDSLKVLKTQKQSIDLNTELEALLLSGLDCLRHVIQQNRETCLQGMHPTAIDPHWLATHAQPIYEQLWERLGDPQAEDAASVLSPEDGQEIIPLLFQTEVEGCLQRLEAVLADPAMPCLREELAILAQELGGLGEMLQLSSFTRLCESITQQVEANPASIEPVAQAALQAWRRSQALILTGNFDALPTAIAGVAAAAEPTLTLEQATLESVTLDAIAIEQATIEHAAIEQVTLESVTLEDLTLADLEADFAAEPFFTDEPAIDFEQALTAAGFDFATVGEDLDSEDLNQSPDNQSPDSEHPDSESFDDLTAFVAPDGTDAATPAAAAEVWFNSPTPDVQTAAAEVWNPTPEVPVTPREPRVADFRVLEVKPDVKADKTAAAPSEGTDTVRVPIKQLNQLNDLFGELTIERNGLDLHLKRLHNLVRTLSHRVQILDRSNAQLRTAYDRLATQGLSTVMPTHSAWTLFSATSGSAASGSAASLGTPDANPGSSIVPYNSRFDSLEMDRYDNMHLLSQEVMETIVQIREVTSDIELGLEDTDQTFRELNKTAKQLQTNLTQVRMRPLSDVLDRFPRAMRELSLQYGKPVELKIHGGSTLIDRNILEALGDPLMHLLRNAFDHGIEDAETRHDRGKPEQGSIEIRAMHRSNRTIITVTDDGGGIPLDKIRVRARQMGLDEVLLAAASDEDLLSLIFEPGFSTTDQVTALSGRGVGMDVVRDNLKQVRGEIKVNTQAGRGTTFTLAVPFTLTVVRVLLAESNGMLLAFPTDVVEEMLVLQPDQVITVAGSEVFAWEDGMAPLVRLHRWLAFHRLHQVEGMEGAPAINEPTVLMVNQGSQRVGVQVDRCWGEQEVATRKVEGNLPMPPGFTNCTILGDGRVVPLVNVPELLHWIMSYERSEQVAVAEIPAVSAATAATAAAPMPLPSLPLPSLPATNRPGQLLTAPQFPSPKTTILIVDDSINVRRFLALTLEKAGYRVEQAKDGQEALEKLLSGLAVNAVICDIEMPRLDGYGFLAQVKSHAELESIPIAMLTSRSGEKHRKLAMSLGATAYFSKPYNEQALLRTLEEITGLAPIASRVS